MRTGHEHIFDQMAAERKIAEAMVHFGFGGTVEKNAEDVRLRREHREQDEAPYLKPDERKAEKVGRIRI